MKTWEQRLDEQVKRRFDNVKKIRINLATARLDDELTIPGDFIYIENASSSAAVCTCKLDKDASASINLYAGTRIETVFTKLYISNDAQANQWIDVVIGIDFNFSRDLDAEDSGTAAAVVIITNAVANTNTIGAAAAATKRILIKADINNTRPVWINFNTAAVQGSCFPLDPGDSLSVRIANINQINANFEFANEKIFVVSES